MLALCRRVGIRKLYFNRQYLLNAGGTIPAKFQDKHTLLRPPLFQRRDAGRAYEAPEDAAAKEMILQGGGELYYINGATSPDCGVLKHAAFSGWYYSRFSSQDFAVLAYFFAKGTRQSRVCENKKRVQAKGNSR